jgi:hypothetical protein
MKEDIYPIKEKNLVNAHKNAKSIEAKKLIEDLAPTLFNKIEFKPGTIFFKKFPPESQRDYTYSLLEIITMGFMDRLYILAKPQNDITLRLINLETGYQSKRSDSSYPIKTGMIYGISPEELKEEFSVVKEGI